MNVWTKRLIGLLILLVIGLVIFDNWFTPDVPPALQQDISLEVDGESQTITPPPTPPTATPPRETAPPSQPAFTLESLDEDNSGPQPVLSNPGANKNKTRDTAPSAGQTAANDSARPPHRQKNPNRAKAVPGYRQARSTAKKTPTTSWHNYKNAAGPVDTELAQVNGKSVHRVFVGPLSAADVPTYIDILGKWA